MLWPRIGAKYASMRWTLCVNLYFCHVFDRNWKNPSYHCTNKRRLHKQFWIIFLPQKILLETLFRKKCACMKKFAWSGKSGGVQHITRQTLEKIYHWYILDRHYIAFLWLIIMGRKDIHIRLLFFCHKNQKRSLYESKTERIKVCHFYECFPFLSLVRFAKNMPVKNPSLQMPWTCHRHTCGRFSLPTIYDSIRFDFYWIKT